MSFDLDYYDDYISPAYAEYLIEKANPVFGIDDLLVVGETGGLENKESLTFLVELFASVKDELKHVLDNRIKDRKFIDERNKAIRVYNEKLDNDFSTPEYKTLLGEKDAQGRIVIGPHSEDYVRNTGSPVAAIPSYLEGHHVTLFGPPDSKKMCVNAMNSFHRKLNNEPEIVTELLKNVTYTPKWGADNEDSKTPLHSDLIAAGINLSDSLDHNLDFTDSKGKEYKLAKSHLSHAIKRFPGLALPSFFMFFQGEPMPLHLYDFALHAFRNWKNKEALVFYVPKLENEEEARYIKIVMETAEKMIKQLHPEYEMGTIRLMIVLENPRAVFRVNEIMDELHPYFVGASLGWHDYLGATARLFKEDPNYRIPVKADPDIVIKYIKASHLLLADIVGERGGIRVGGMYGILPTTYDLNSPSFQITILGYLRDVITQLKRNLTGFWVAHPDFVRLGMAIVEAWLQKRLGDGSKLEILVKSLLNVKYHNEILEFINGPDIKGLDVDDPMYARSLLVADIGESNIISNNDPKEIRYNIFQSLQYITDWLSGNGCVALPTNIGGEAVRIMDDLATAERSRWEVWHELYHGRFELFEFLKIAHEEFHFIRKDLSDDKKIVQVKWNENNAKWYPVAFQLMIKLMTDKKPAEFATELLLPFTIDEVRNHENPWKKALEIDSEKFKIEQNILNYNYYFEMCGEKKFASSLSSDLVTDLNKVKQLIMSFDKNQIISAASFHGDIGESKKTLDKMATSEQSKVFNEDEKIKSELCLKGDFYLKKFGVKFLVSAKGKSGSEILKSLNARINNSESEELVNAKKALFEITEKRINEFPLNNLANEIDELKKKFNVNGIQLSLSLDGENIQNLCFGTRNKIDLVDVNTSFEIASLSKTIGSALALSVFETEGISLDSRVNDLLAKFGSNFRLNEKEFSNKVSLKDLMGHCALNMHYVNGVPLNTEMPPISEFLKGNNQFGYVPVEVINEPGRKFKYSGAGFIVLEHLIECITKKSFSNLLSSFLNKLKINGISSTHDENYAWGFKDDNSAVEDTRLQFPMIAAGMMGNSNSMMRFLHTLSNAYSNVEGYNEISHDTAVQMLHGKDIGSVDFMGCLMGLGVFTAECGENKVMIHQGANDGYRTIYLQCYSGPDKGKGFCIFSNSELNSVFLNSFIAQRLLKSLKFSGIDFNKFELTFDPTKLSQEEIVNCGYKKFIFDSFLDNLPDVSTSDEIDPLSNFNILNGSKVIKVSNQKFARASNLLLSTIPKFDPELFGKQGKVMDSWESVRHNPYENEMLHIKLKKTSSIKSLYLSTKFHDGNHVDYVSIQGLNDKKEWIDIIAKTKMLAHSFKKIVLSNTIDKISELKVLTFPDGGFTRLKLFDHVPDLFKECEVTRFLDPIPETTKSLNLTSNKRVNIEQMRKTHSLIDIACSAFGATVISATDEHYAPASQSLSPFGAIDMFDGLESARSRTLDNFEEVVIQLASKEKIDSIVLDFTYFVNNNPSFVELQAYDNGIWETLVDKNDVKAFAGNKKCYSLKTSKSYDRVKLLCFPDGGMNRIYVYAKV